MDFFASQDHARRKTALLVGYFVLAVVCIIASIYFVFAYLFLEMEDGSRSLFDPALLALVTFCTLAVISVGSVYKTAMLSSGGGASVATMLGGTPIDANTTDLDERRLLNVVEEMALASGTPVPPVYLLRDETGINAFAAGFTPTDAVIGVTRGCMQMLSRDELQGVIAHEFSHVLRGDMRLNLRLMGILHGILVISLIGYFLLRLSTPMRRTYFSDKKKGGNPLPLIGLALYIIGYAGVFCGKLIKSAISRQREYLADASAVQFTRNPPGIAGALKKIGGYSEGARIQDPHAEQASHMFFGSALRFDFFGLMATHPPLDDRVRRLDPSFDGKFPRVNFASAQPEGDPEQVAAQMAAAEPVMAELVAPAAAMAFSPRDVAAHVGAPQPEHVRYAARLIESLPSGLRDNLHELPGAYATVLALLLDRDDEARERQMALLAEVADTLVLQSVQQAWPLVAQVQPAARLPVVELAIPMLRSMSPQQFEQFQQQVRLLAEADQRTSLFEFALERMIVRHLRPTFMGRHVQRLRYHRVAPLAEGIGRLLSVVAHAGHADGAEARQAYEAGMRLAMPSAAPPEMLPRDAADLRQLDTDLDELALAVPTIKRHVLEACAESIGSDGNVTVAEGELLRAIADSLDCPMPPLLASDA